MQIHLTGSDTVFIKLCLKLFFTSLVLSILPHLLHLNVGCTVCYCVFLYILTVAFLVYSHFILDIKYQTNSRNLFVKNLLKSGKFQALPDVPIYTTSTSSASAEVVRCLYLTCNSYQRDLFETKGYVIFVGSKSELKDFLRKKSIFGYFSKSFKYILVYTTYEEKTNGVSSLNVVPLDDIKSTFWHEWGHFLDFLNNNISKTVWFKDIYKTEKKDFYSSVSELYPNINKHSRLFKSFSNEFKNSSEYFACYYSKHHRGLVHSDYLSTLFDRLDGVSSADKH